MISVVVPTRDRPEALARCLAALARQRGDEIEIEIVVVDDGASGGGATAPGARVVRAAGAGPAAARNLGARATRGDVVCFTDDDCVPAPDWAQRLASACAGGGAAAGTTIADPAAGPAAAAAQLLTNTLMLSTRERAPTGGGATLRFAPTCNLACHADTLRALPFDESFALAAGEDRDWCARLVAAGAPLRHVPDAAVVHRPQLGLRGLVRQQVRYGRGAVGFRDTGGVLAGPDFYRRLARATAHAGPRTAACLALAQVAVAAGAGLAIAEQRLAR